MAIHCPMCGRDLGGDFEETFLAPAVCPACGTAIGGGVEGPTAVDLEAARQRVRWPAAGLMIVGGLVVLSSAAFPALIGTALLTDPPLLADGEDKLGLFVTLAMTAAAGLGGAAAGGAIAFGGYRMYHLQSHPLAVTASTFAIAIVFASCLVFCCPFMLAALAGLPGFPIGIWSLVVLNDANVQAAFRVTAAANRSENRVA
jgi:hypothetical protein